MKNKRLLISIVAGALALIMLLSLVAAVLPAVGAVSSDELKNQLDELKEQQEAISQKIEDLEKEQTDNLSELEAVIARKNVIDQQVALLYQQVANVNSQISAYNLMIADKQTELEQAQARLEQLNEQNKERIRAMEEEGELSYWSVLFMANDFSDLLDRVNMIQEIAAADRKRLQEMSDIALEIEQAQAALEEDKVGLEAVKVELEKAQEELDVKNTEAEQVLAELTAVSEELSDLHEQFEKEEEKFLDELLTLEQEYEDKLEEEESSRQASIAASIQESIRESSIQASIDASIEASIQASMDAQQATQSGGSSQGSEVVTDPDGIRWVVPVSYSYVSSPFGYRWHPITGEWAMHKGVDLPAPKGTPIYASRSGFVTIASYHSTAGNYVKIDHQDGFTSVYMHMTHYVVEKGEYVNAGQLIGYVGTTGRSKGYHLHFGITYNGAYVNPMDYIG